MKQDTTGRRKYFLIFLSKTKRHTGAPVEVPPVLKNKQYQIRISIKFMPVLLDRYAQLLVGWTQILHYGTEQRWAGASLFLV